MQFVLFLALNLHRWTAQKQEAQLGCRQCEQRAGAGFLQGPEAELPGVGLGVVVGAVEGGGQVSSLRSCAEDAHLEMVNK
jgi:hypothetical protein